MSSPKVSAAPTPAEIHASELRREASEQQRERAVALVDILQNRLGRAVRLGDVEAAATIRSQIGSLGGGRRGTMAKAGPDLLASRLGGVGAHRRKRFGGLRFGETDLKPDRGPRWRRSLGRGGIWEEMAVPLRPTVLGPGGLLGIY